MSIVRLIGKNLSYFWRTHLSVLLGTALATAVLTGALLVGDSVDWSLRQSALSRLGGIHYALNSPDRLFSADLVADLAQMVDSDVESGLQLSGMAISQRHEKRQVNKVDVLGINSNFWKFAGIDLNLAGNEVAINAKLATAIGVEVGAELSLRIEKPSILPRSAPLSAQNLAQTVRGRFTVRRILNNTELGNFNLSASQIRPYNAFVNMEWLQERVGLTNRVNAIFAGAGTDVQSLDQAVSSVWTPRQLGLRIQKRTDIIQLSSERVYLDSETARAAIFSGDGTGLLVYLVNSISCGEKRTPYSFMLAGGVSTDMRDDEIIVNQWLADQLDISKGDSVRVEYSGLLSSGGFEKRTRSFTVHSVVPMASLEVERVLMPDFPGLSDVESCKDWDAGIPMDRELLKDLPNEEYWKQYGETPKAIVTLAAGRSMWANRFGNLTAVRWDGRNFSDMQIRRQLRAELDPSKTGLFFRPVYRQALAAVSNAIDFGQLFLGMSFFLIAASLMLTALLFVFGVQCRAEEMGTLLALGWRQRRVRSLFLGEGGVIALLGSALGALFATGYTRFLIWGLNNCWRNAVANSTIQYHAETVTIVTGTVVSFACAIGAIAIALFLQSRCSARDLLTVDQTIDRAVSSINDNDGTRRGRNAVSLCLPVVTLMGAIGIVVRALLGDTGNIVILFFVAGVLLLISGIGFIRFTLGRVYIRRKGEVPTLNGLAVQNAEYRRGRSLTVIALLASGCFIIFSVSSMREDITAHARQSWAGTGGFELFGKSTVPIPGQSGGEIFQPLDSLPIKVRDGDDASCLNLNRAQTPRLLGVDPDSMSARRAFFKRVDVWKLLKKKLPDGVVPALVGDSDTAMWGLEKRTGLKDGEILSYRDESGTEFSVKLVGELPMRLSVFQGSILISNTDFTRLYPSEAGYRMFLLNVPAGEEEKTIVKLNSEYERYGLDMVPSVARLLEFYTVESTYLGMFLILGALGVVVGNVGMGIVVLRNIRERQSEIALLRAIGYRRSMIRRLLISEHALLLVAGLGTGVLASMVSILPAIVILQTSVSPVSLAVLLFSIAATGAASIIVAVEIGNLDGV